MVIPHTALVALLMKRVKRGWDQAARVIAANNARASNRRMWAHVRANGGRACRVGHRSTAAPCSQATRASQRRHRARRRHFRTLARAWACRPPQPAAPQRGRRRPLRRWCRRARHGVRSARERNSGPPGCAPYAGWRRRDAASRGDDVYSRLAARERVSALPSRAAAEQRQLPACEARSTQRRRRSGNARCAPALSNCSPVNSVKAAAALCAAMPPVRCAMMLAQPARLEGDTRAVGADLLTLLAHVPGWAAAPGTAVDAADVTLTQLGGAMSNHIFRVQARGRIAQRLGLPRATFGPSLTPGRIAEHARRRAAAAAAAVRLAGRRGGGPVRQRQRQRRCGRSAAPFGSARAAVQPRRRGALRRGGGGTRAGPAVLRAVRQRPAGGVFGRLTPVRP